nr:hypothetical protein [Tanacetum cinerariifolium]
MLIIYVKHSDADDPYVAVRHAQLVVTDTKSDPEEAPSEVEELRPLGSRVPLTDEEFEASDPSGTRTDSSHSSASLDSTTPLSPDHPLTQVSPTLTPTRASFHRRTTRIIVRTQPAISLGLLARVTEVMALSDLAFHIDSEGDKLGDEDTDEGGEDESYDADDVREGLDDEGHGLDDEGHGLDDEGHGLDEEDHGLKKDGLGLEEALRRRELAVEEDQLLSTFEVGQSFRSMPEQQGAERVSVFRQPTLTAWVDPEDGGVYTNIRAYVPPVAPVQTPPSPELSSGAQLELHESILHDHTQRLDALPPTLFANIGRDVRELYTRSGQLEMRSFHRGQINAQRATLWHAIYDIQREIHGLGMQLAEERRERLKLADRIARMERR